MFHRKSNSGRVLAAVLGAFMLPAGAALLIWNEIHARDRAAALSEGGSTVIEAPPNRVDPALEGRLVFVAGRLTLPQPLSDPDIPAIAAPPDAVLLRRLVQTYQWEERTSRGNNVSYAQTWSDRTIDSTSFRQPVGATNPPPRFRATTLAASGARLDSYRIPEPLLRTLHPAQPMALPSAALPSGLTLTGNTLYAGPEPGTPHIGDQRLTWETVRLTEASVVAQQKGDGFVPYAATSGETIFLISPGLLTPRLMLGEAAQSNDAAAWVFRVLGAGLVALPLLLLRRTRVSA